MSCIAINNLSFSYKKYFQPIFQDVNINIDTKWKLGLVGRNGRGKSTLLKLILNELEPDKGEIVKDVYIQYFPYEVNAMYTYVIDVIKECIGNVKSIEDEMDSIIENNDVGRYNRYNLLLEKYEEVDGFNIEGKIKKELFLMHLPEELLYHEFSTLSNGERTKMLIIALFLKKNSFILLDEPTNNLDINGRRAMKEYLKKKNGYIVVSHDRYFLNQVVDHIISINKSNVTIEKGNYSSWKENKDKQELFESKVKNKLLHEINQLENSSVNNRKWGELAEKEKNPFKTNNRGNGARAEKFMRSAKISERRIEEKIKEKKELLKNIEVVPDLSIDQSTNEKELLIEINNLQFGYQNKKIFEDFSLQIFSGDIIWIKGENGAGKSTLLNVITKKIETLSVKYVKEDIKIVEVYQEPIWKNGYLNKCFDESIDREKFKELCTCLDISEMILERPLETYSDGELRKIDIARALSSNNHIILLDEPLNYMDIYFQEQLEKAIVAFSPTMIFVEHDETFGNRISNRCINL